MDEQTIANELNRFKGNKNTRKRVSKLASTQTKALSDKDREVFVKTLESLPPDVRDAYKVVASKLTTTDEAMDLMTKMNAYLMTRKKEAQDSNLIEVIIRFEGDEDVRS
jgi:hypothetical protein